MGRLTNDIDMMESPERGEAPSLILSETGDDTDLDVSFAKSKGEDEFLATEADATSDSYLGSELSDSSKVEAAAFDKDERDAMQREEFDDEPEFYFTEASRTELPTNDSSSTSSQEETIDQLFDELMEEQKRQREASNSYTIVKKLDTGNLETIVEVGSILERGSSQANQSEGKCEKSAHDAPMKDIVIPAEADVSSELEDENEAKIQSSKLPSSDNSTKSDDSFKKDRENMKLDSTYTNKCSPSNIDEYFIAVTLTQEDIETNSSDSEKISNSPHERSIHEINNQVSEESQNTLNENNQFSDDLNNYENAINTVQKEIDEVKQKQVMDSRKKKEFVQGKADEVIGVEAVLPSNIDMVSSEALIVTTPLKDLELASFPPSYYIEREWSENSSSNTSMVDDTIFLNEDRVSVINERKVKSGIPSPPNVRKKSFDGVFQAPRARSQSVPKFRKSPFTKMRDRPDSEPVHGGQSRRVCNKAIDRTGSEKRENLKSKPAFPRYLQLYQMSKLQNRSNRHGLKVTYHRPKERKSSLLPSSDDIFTRLYNLSKPMQELGKEKRTQMAAKGETEGVLERPKTRPLDYNPGLRLYEQGMQSKRNLEERRAERHGAGYRSPLRNGIKEKKKEKNFHLF